MLFDTYAHFRKDPADYKAWTGNAKRIADFQGANVEEVSDEANGANFPLADEQACDA